VVSGLLQTTYQTERRACLGLDINMFTDGHKANGAKKLPLNLLDALRALDKSSVLKSALRKKPLASYIRLKQEDWNDYSRHLTDWERQTTLDC